MTISRWSHRSSQVKRCGRKSFEIKRQCNIYSMVKRTISTVSSTTVCLRPSNSTRFGLHLRINLIQRFCLQGDELETRCIYSTSNKNKITLVRAQISEENSFVVKLHGGESTKDEMCLHMFSYYPRVNNLYTCLSLIPLPSWTVVVDSSV